MNADRIRVLTGLELRQRIRSVAWYVLLSIFAAVLLIITALSFLTFSGTGQPATGVYSVIVFAVLLLAVLVSPALSGNAINGDRDAATLAPVQVTLVTTGEIILAKFVAAWVTGLAFLVVAVPFLAIATASGGLSVTTMLVSLAVLIVEIGVVAAIGVGLSGILARPLFSVTSTYLVVAALTVGTVIAFGLVGTAMKSEVTSSYREAVYDENGSIEGCDSWQATTYEAPRFDRVWWMLAANPFVILADATPATFGDGGYPTDLFGSVAFGVRSAQLPPQAEIMWDGCNPGVNVSDGPTPAEIYASTTPSWFVGIALQLVLAAALLWGAWARTRTPARRLPPGTRIA